jgi:hypothetical protein
MEILTCKCKYLYMQISSNMPHILEKPKMIADRTHQAAHAGGEGNRWLEADDANANVRAQ